MKRILFSTLILLVASIGFAQKANVSKAQNKALAVENPDINGAKDAIDAALANPETAGQAKTLYVAGVVYEKAAETEANKGESADFFQVGEDAIKAYNYYVDAYRADQTPDAKGKVKPKYTNKIKSALLNIYRRYYLFNYGIKQYEAKDYRKAVDALEIHTNIAKLPYIAETNAIPMDSNFYDTHLLAGMMAWTGMEENPELGAKAIAHYSALKGTGYKENDAYQVLAQIYQAQQDTTNYMATLNEGIAKYPEEFFFLGSLINYYITTGQVDRAENYIETAIQNDPDNSQLYNTRGGMYANREQYAEAKRNYEKAISLDPQNAEYVANLADVINQMAMIYENKAWDQKTEAAQELLLGEARSQFKEAASLYEKSLELKGDNYDVMKKVRSIYYKLSNKEKSFEAKYAEMTNRMNNL